MTFYQLFLYIHLGGAAITGLAIFTVLLAIVLKKSAVYALQAKIIAGITTLQFVSGSGLALTDQNPSVLTFCSKLGVYLAIILIVEIALFFKMKKVKLSFPLKPIAVSLGSSAMVALATVIVMIAM